MARVPGLYTTKRQGEVVAMLLDASRDISARLGCTQFPLDVTGRGS